MKFYEVLCELTESPSKKYILECEMPKISILAGYIESELQALRKPRIFCMKEGELGWMKNGYFSAIDCDGCDECNSITSEEMLSYNWVEVAE